MSRTTARRRLAPGTQVPRGEVLVVTEVGDPVRGALACPAAPLVGGSLARRGARVRYGPVASVAEEPQAGDGAALFLASALGRDGTATGIAAAASPVDGVAVAAARTAVEEWSAAVSSRRLLAAGGPWCPGARRALSLAWAALAEGGPVHVCEWLAAGAADRAALQQAGAVFVASPDEVPDGGTVVLPAHGTSPPALAAARRRLTVVDATCPLVAAVHEQARRSAGRGDDIVVVGAAGHAAAGPLADQAPGKTTIVESPARASGVRPTDPRRVSALVQPGIPIEDAAAVSAALSSRFPALRGPDPGAFCYAATDRMEAIRTIASACGIVLVLGPGGHPDTTMVCRAVRAAGGKAQAVLEPGAIAASWLAGADAVGLVETTAAAPGLAAGVIGALSGLGPLSVARRQVTTEVTGRGDERN